MKPWFLCAPQSGVYEHRLKAECFQSRIKACLFIDGAIGVSQHKEALDPDNPVLGLIESLHKGKAGSDAMLRCKAIQTSFYDWISFCQANYDQGTTVEGAGTTIKGITYYTVTTPFRQVRDRKPRDRSKQDKAKTMYLAIIYKTAKSAAIMAGLTPWVPGLSVPSLKLYPPNRASITSSTSYK